RHLDPACEVAAERVLGIPRFEIEGIVAERLRTHLFNRRSLERFVDPVVRRLAPADEAAVGLEAHQQCLLVSASAIAALVGSDGRLLRNADTQRVELSDFHGGSFGGGWKAELEFTRSDRRRSNKSRISNIEIDPSPARSDHLS